MYMVMVQSQIKPPHDVNLKFNTLQLHAATERVVGYSVSLNWTTQTTSGNATDVQHIGRGGRRTMVVVKSIIGTWWPNAFATTIHCSNQQPPFAHSTITTPLESIEWPEICGSKDQMETLPFTSWQHRSKAPPRHPITLFIRPHFVVHQHQQQKLRQESRRAAKGVLRKCIEFPHEQSEMSFQGQNWGWWPLHSALSHWPDQASPDCP